MKKYYINSIICLVVITIVTLLIHIITAIKDLQIISNIFGNISIGLVTGFVLLLITNLKNSLIYQNEQKIRQIRNLIDKSRDCEIKVLNYKNQEMISVIDLISFYADLSNLFYDIMNYNKEFLDINKCDIKKINSDCNEMLEKLTELMHEGNITAKKYSDDFDWDLSKKIILIFKLRKNLQSDLNLIEKENEKLYKSIL